MQREQLRAFLSHYTWEVLNPPDPKDTKSILFTCDREGLTSHLLSRIAVGMGFTSEDLKPIRRPEDFSNVPLLEELKTLADLFSSDPIDDPLNGGVSKFSRENPMLENFHDNLMRSISLYGSQDKTSLILHLQPKLPPGSPIELSEQTRGNLISWAVDIDLGGKPFAKELKEIQW